MLHRIQRGSALWPFVIALLLFLVFGYMWYDERGKREGAEARVLEATKANEGLRRDAVQLSSYLSNLSARVGWRTKAGSEVSPLATDTLVTDIALLEQHLKGDGAVEGRPGLYNWLRTEAKMTFDARMRSATGEGATETRVDFSAVNSDFRRRLEELQQIQGEKPTPPRPAIPGDPDDERRAEDIAEQTRIWEEWVRRFNQKLDELMRMEDWPKYERIVKSAPRFSLATQGVEVTYWRPTTAGADSLETLLNQPPVIIRALMNDFRANKVQDATVISQLEADRTAQAAENTRLQGELTQSQDRHSREVGELRNERTDLSDQLARARDEARTALDSLGTAQQSHETAVRGLREERSVLENRIRVDKEVRDLAIRRDDPDGRIVGASSRLGTGTIDLGSADKVYPGLKFAVSYLGRGGIREQRGEVQVIRVTGPKSAQVAILAEDPANPIAVGDMISNPFYSASEPIHLVIVGELEKYPLEIVKARLRRMNVIIDPAVNGDTDYIVVPNSLAAPAAKAAGSEDDDEEEPAGPSELERVQQLARTFGATVITERMLNRFLDY